MQTFYWVSANGTWSDVNYDNWSFFPGGPGGDGIPSSGDTVYFDTNSGSNFTVNLTTTALLNNVSVANPTINLVFQKNLTTNNFILNSGTLTLNNHSLTTNTFYSNTSNPRTIDFATSSVIKLIPATKPGQNTLVWDTANATNFVGLGSSNIYCNYTGSGNLQFNIHQVNASNPLSFNINANTTGSLILDGYGINPAGTTIYTLNFLNSNATFTVNNGITVRDLILSKNQSTSYGTANLTFANILNSNNTVINFPLRFYSVTTTGDPGYSYLKSNTIINNNLYIDYGFFSTDDLFTFGDPVYTLTANSIYVKSVYRPRSAFSASLSFLVKIIITGSGNCFSLPLPGSSATSLWVIGGSNNITFTSSSAKSIYLGTGITVPNIVNYFGPLNIVGNSYIYNVTSNSSVSISGNNTIGGLTMVDGVI